MAIYKISDLSEEQKRKLMQQQQKEEAERKRTYQQYKQREQQEASQKFNEAVQQRGTVDKNRHTFMVKDLSKNSSRIATNILNPNKTIGGTIFNNVGKFGSEIGGTIENTWLGMINGIKDFQKNFNINTQDPLVQNKLITQSVSEKIKRNNPLGSMLLNGISNSNPQYVDKKLEKRKENIEKLQEEKNRNTEKILDNTEKISNPVMKKISELAPSVGQMIPMYVPVLGNIYAMGSAQGAYYDEAKQRGMNEADAMTFSSLMGIFEGLTEMVGVSSIKKGGKTISALIKGTGKEVAKEGVETLGKAGIKEALKQYGIGIADNVIQEAIIEPIQESVATLTGGADKAEWENMGQRMLQSGIDGGLVAAIMGGANAGGNACISLIQKVNSGQTPTIQEIQTAIKEANESEKVDIENLIIESTQQQINKIANENNIANNSQENVQQNATNNQLIQNSQQITPLQQQTAQNGTSSQIQENGQNVSNLMQTAVQYNKDTNDTSLKLVDEMLNRRNIEGRFDETLFNDNNVNAIWRVTGINEDGTPQREVIFNPNTDSKTALIELSVHEIAHDLEGGDTYTKLSERILKNLQSKDGYEQLRQTYEKAYSKVYDENSNVFTELIDDEIVADTLAKNLGNQEFINELVNQDRSTMQKIWDWIKQKINSLKGNTDEKVYWQDVSNKFVKAFNQEYQGTSEQTTKYFINTVAEFDEMEYNNTREVMLPKKEYGILSHIINSDSNIKPGLNYVETTNARYTVYYKEPGEFKVIDKEINDGNSRNDTTTKRNISRSNTTGNEKTRSNLSSTEVQYGETRTNNDKIPRINKERTREGIRSNFSSEKNIRNSIENSNQSSFSMQGNIKEFDITNGLDDYNGTTSIFFDTTEKGYHVTATGKGGELINEATFIDKKGLTRHFGEELAEYIIQNSKTDSMQEVKVQANESKDYRMAHRPSELGANASDISNNGEVMPKDVYEHPEWYFDMTKEYSKESLEVLKNIKGNPEAEITIYRATTGNEINEGDWVTLSKKYAEHHNNAQLNGEGNVVELRVKAKDVQFAGDDINEFGYFPENKSKVESSSVVEDNKGRKLTKEQQEFFKDSKVVDEKGNLLTLYHGTPFGDFTIFNDKDMYFFSTKEQFAEDYAYQKSFEQELDGDIEVKEVYVKAKKVFDPLKEEDIQALRNKLPEQVKFFSTVLDKETFLNRIQRKMDLEPKWSKEQIKNAKFGKVIGNDRWGYNNDIFIGINKNNEVVYVDHSNYPVFDYLTKNEEKNLKEKLLRGEEEKITLYTTPIGQMTEDTMREKLKTLDEQIKPYIKSRLDYIDNGENYMVDSSSYEITPYTATQEIEHLNDIDNWEYLEGANVWEDGKLGKDIIDIIKDLGYDGIKMYEKGEENYAVFKKNQIKNVDNLNPTDNPDIRYSIDNQEIDDWLNKNVPHEGEKGKTIAELTKRPIAPLPNKEQNKPIAPLPEKANNDDTLTIPVEENKPKDIAPLGRNARMRKHYDTVMKSPTTSKEAKKIARELMGTDTYVAEANKEQLKRADERIKNNQDGVDGELKALSAKLASGENFNTNDMAVSMRLEEYYSKTGEKAKLQEAIQLTAMAGTQAGRTVQELSMIKRMTPQGQAIWIQRTVDDMNGKLARRKGGKIVTDEYGIPVKNEDGRIKVVDKKGKDISNKVNLFDLTPDMLSKIRNSTKENLEQNIDEIYNQLGKQVSKDIWQKLDSWRYFAMLANPRTHLRNIVGNVGMGAAQKVKNKVAGAIEDIIGAVNPSMERTHTLRVASQEVREFAKKDINNVKERLYDGNKYNPKSRLENSMRTFESETLEQTLGRLFNMNDKALEAEDGWGLKAGYVRAMADYMTANKLTPKNITDKQLSTARNYAIEQAKEATFHQVSKLATAIENLSRKNGFTKFATDATLPFKKTPINIAKAGASYSPVGLAKSLIVDTVQLKKGNITINQYIDNISKGLTGTGIAFLGYVLTDIGILKASGGDDDDKENYDESLGNQTYSIKIGENTYSLDWLTPSGIPLFIGSELCQIAQRKAEVKESSTDEDSKYNQAMETGSNILNAFANSMNPMAEMSLLSGLTSALQSYEQGSSQMFAAMGTNAVKSYVNQYVPTLLGQISKTFDDYERATTTTKTETLSKAVDQAKNQIMSKIPGLRQKLPIKTDIWGNEIKQSDNIIARTFENGIAPWTRRSLASSKVDEEIDNLYERIGESSIIPKRIQKNITLNSQNYRLTNEEYIKYQKEYGQVAYKLLDKIVTSKEYGKLSDTQKQKVIEEVYSYAKEKNKVNYANKINQAMETSTTYNVIEKLKKSGLNEGDYLNYIGKTKEVEKDSDKKAILIDSSYSEETKDIIYTNTIGKDDKTYKYVSNADVNFNTYAKATNRIKEIKDEYASTENMTSKQKTAMTNKRKTQVLTYINSLELSRQQKLILQKTIGGYSIKNYKSEVVEYVNRLNITNAEREEMISKLF